MSPILLYGGTSFIAGTNQKEVKLKEYRYSAKERDDTTGLYYYGARYYAPWLGRWMSADPKRENDDGLNLYAFVRNNPIKRTDPDGMESTNTLTLDNLEEYKAANYEETDKGRTGYQFSLSKNKNGVSMEYREGNINYATGKQNMCVGGRC